MDEIERGARSTTIGNGQPAAPTVFHGFDLSSIQLVHPTAGHFFLISDLLYGIFLNVGIKDFFLACISHKFHMNESVQGKGIMQWQLSFS